MILDQIRLRGSPASCAGLGWCNPYSVNFVCWCFGQYQHSNIISVLHPSSSKFTNEVRLLCSIHPTNSEKQETLHYKSQVFWWIIVDLFSWNLSYRDLLYNSLMHSINCTFLLCIALYQFVITCTALFHCFVLLGMVANQPVTNRREQFSKLDISFGSSSPLIS